MVPSDAYGAPEPSVNVCKSLKAVHGFCQSYLEHGLESCDAQGLQRVICSGEASIKFRVSFVFVNFRVMRLFISRFLSKLILSTLPIDKFATWGGCTMILDFLDEVESAERPAYLPRSHAGEVFKRRVVEQSKLTIEEIAARLCVSNYYL